jgi:glutamate-1-semialdehyde aminotransferase
LIFSKRVFLFCSSLAHIYLPLAPCRCATAFSAGVTALGHRHPKLIERWNEIISDSACIVGVASPDACVLAEKLVDRFQMPFWRFMNSGTEATLDAIR